MTATLLTIWPRKRIYGIYDVRASLTIASAQSYNGTIMNITETINPATLARLAEGVARSEYSLLLGAGASMGALGGNGERLPSGPQLSTRLIQAFDVPVGDAVISLPRAYSAAKRADPVKLEAFMKEWFTGCKPDWQRVLADFQWHRVWTLNVDDVVETVFRTSGIHFDRLNWKSTFRDTARSDRQIIHLHGYVDDTLENDTQTSDLVFSINEYAATLRDRRSWHSVFTDEFGERPFVVLGASLTEEFDLQQALAGSAATTARGFPSVIVLKSVSDLERAELSALGLLVFEAEAKDFMRVIGNAIKEYNRMLGTLYKQPISEYMHTFLQQFDNLRQLEPIRKDSNNRFYSGYEPSWRNILDADDAIFDTTEKSFAAIAADPAKEPPNQLVHLLTGNSGTGKSTGLLRIAQCFVAAGRPTFWFRGVENLNVDAAFEWLQRMPDTVLLFNDCADFAEAIGRLAQECASHQTNLLVIGAERSGRREMLENKIEPRFLRLLADYEYRTLSDNDINALINKLKARTRLGHITRFSRSGQENYFRRTASRRLFEGMANLEGGLGFHERIKNTYDRIVDDRLRQLYTAASIAYELGYPLPMGVASKVAGLRAIDLENLMADEAQEILVLDYNGVHPPHRITASMVVESALSPQAKYAAIQSLTTALAPHIDISAIRKRTLPYRLIRRLMDQETILRLIGPSDGRLMFEHMQDLYDWNGRYWEQRALLESALGNHRQARSYAERAVQILSDPFAWNTLGTILGRMAVEIGDASVLRQSVDYLEKARTEPRWDESQHPYFTFFTTMVKFGEIWGVHAMPRHLRNDFTEWHKVALRSPVFRTLGMLSQLQTFHSDWLRLSIATSESQ